ncbi:Uncharacterized protein dnm_053620 [Desulfonema magnum]|uniref:Uncharacterized protein n=1 Tax=Desulfonema magnum TaxID=45655 RepID=A0A975BPZ1_9BACT|nr:Uncharacterized protein dnm_053620 [Desulfonema magnum]
MDIEIYLSFVLCEGCRTGFATPSETFAGGDPENIPDGVANPVRQNQS